MTPTRAPMEPENSCRRPGSGSTSARIVVVHPGRDVPIVNRRREARWLSDGLAHVAEIMPSGMQLALETMGVKSLAGPADEMLEVVDPLRSANVGICFDTGHVNQGDDIFAYLRAIAGRVITVHLHDNYGDRDAHAIPGEGNIRWPETLHALRVAGYLGPWMAETGPKKGSVAAFVNTYRKRMRAYLRKSECGRLESPAPLGSETFNSSRAIEPSLR